MEYTNLTLDNLASEHICCAIADKKHQVGVDIKKQWLADRIKEGHVFRKLNERGKIFIEYAPLEKAWVSVDGKNYMFIYCHWVSGSFKGKGIGRELLEYCIKDAKDKGKSGVCVISAKTKKPFLSDKAFMSKFGFVTVDTLDGGYELLALSFDGTKPRFNDNAKVGKIDSKDLTIYYGIQCPYIPDCIQQVQAYCTANKIPLNLIKVDTLEKAKSMPCVFNNWAVFYKGEFVTNHLLNEGYLKKMILQS
jgi:N-acetylglutamate synthase-like GNAT family acetyltransferase